MYVDREVDDHAGALGEDSRAPELRADREAPLGGREALSSDRSWKMPTAVVMPSGTTAKQA
jgi:hypothetical protein